MKTLGFAPILSLTLSLLLPAAPLQAGRIVAEIPAPNTNIGGASAAGAAVNTPGAASLNLAQPSLSGLGLPSVAAANVSAAAGPSPAALTPAPQAGAAAPNAPLRSLPAGGSQTGAAPAVGSEDFQKSLQTVGENAREAGASAEGPRPGSNGETGYASGRVAFDGAVLRPGGVAAPVEARNAVPAASGRRETRLQAAPVPGERPASDPLLVDRIEHDGASYTSGYTFDGKPLRYFNGSGSKILFRHPAYRDYLLTLFPKKSPRDVTRLDKARRDADILDAAMVSRSNRKYEMDGRKLLEPHKLTPPTPLKAGRTILRDAKGAEWNTSYIVQERVYGDTVEDIDVEDLKYVQALFKRLRELRLEVPDDANLLRNIMVGWTASDPRVRAYVVDAEGTKYVGPQSLIDTWLKRPDPLAKHYAELYAKVRGAVTSRPARTSVVAAFAKSPHPIKTAEDAAFRKGKADESTWWRRRDFAAARGPVMTVGEALAKLSAGDLGKLQARLGRIRNDLGEDGAYRRAIVNGAAAAEAEWSNPYRYFLTQSAAFQTKVKEGYPTGLPLEGVLAVNQVTRDKIELPESEKFEAPAFVMGVFYNLFFDYAGRPRDPVKTDVLVDYVLSL